MQKILFAVFAHPDDEAFGPSGTLVLETRAGTELHLVTLTCGQAGQNPDQVDDLGAVRLGEWQQAAKLMGAARTYHLDYHDGQLCNQTLIDAQARVVELIRDVAAQHDEPYEIELMTIDDNGITGHIDHTVASRAASYAYYSLKADGLPLSRIRYICAPHQVFAAPNTSWIYMPAGRTPAEIDEIIDARSVLDTVHEIIRCHHTQRGDAEALLAARGDDVAVNHFMVRR